MSKPWVDIKIRTAVKKRLDTCRRELLKNSPAGTKMGYSELIAYLLDHQGGGTHITTK